jgi:agmatine deiminase
MKAPGWRRTAIPACRCEEIGARLMAAYGAERIIWAPGVAGLDITDYHIDSLARFTGPGRVLINLPAAIPTRAIRSMPRHSKRGPAGGRRAGDRRDRGTPAPPRPVPRFRCVLRQLLRLQRRGDHGGIRRPGGRRRGGEAIARHYPDREIVTLDVDALGVLGGGIHCATQQWPAT